MRTSFIGFLIGMSVLSLLSPAFGQSKFSLAITAAPNFHYVDTEVRSNLPIGNGLTRPVDINFRLNGYGYSVGIAGSYWLSERLSVSTGILLNSVRYPKPNITTNPDLTASPNGPQTLSLVSTVRSFQVPLSVNYRSSTKHLSPYFSVGAITNVYSVNIFGEGSKSQNTVDEIQPHPTLGTGIDYRINNHFSLIMQPNFVYFLPYGKVISYKNYQMGLRTQLLYKF